jgi:hypothetical protein
MTISIAIVIKGNQIESKVKNEKTNSIEISQSIALLELLKSKQLNLLDKINQA